MAAQKVVISKDLKADLQAFFASLSYDKLFILTDTNTQDKCFPLVKDIPAFQNAPVITVQAGDTHKDIEQVASIWARLSNEGASRKSSVPGLNDKPHMAKRFPVKSVPKCEVIFLNNTLFWFSFTRSTAFSNSRLCP